MTDPLDAAEREPTANTAHLSGIQSAASAGASLLHQDDKPRTRRLRGGVKFELPAYLGVQSTWFMAFGLQIVLFPYLITSPQHLNLGGTELGLANLALSAPSVIFLLLGGVVAERMSGKPLLMALHLLAGLPAAGLAFALATGTLAYAHMILYGLTLGLVGAFMMPARDAILNEVIARRMRLGSAITLQKGVAFATLVQFAAQIAGLVMGGYADKATRMPDWLGGFAIGPIDSWRLLALQAIILGSGSVFAILLARGRRVRTGRSGVGAAFGDIAEGYRVVRSDPLLYGMTILMFGVGVFVIGSFLVVLPIINRDVYGFGSDGIRDMFVTFWIGAFLSSVAMSVTKSSSRPGQLLLYSQSLGTAIILGFLFPIDHWMFLSIVFIGGLAAGVSITMSRAIVQDAAPKDQLARVLSFYQLGFMAGTPIGAAMMGALTDAFGYKTVAVVAVSGMTAVISWILLRTPIWKLDSSVLK